MRSPFRRLLHGLLAGILGLAAAGCGVSPPEPPGRPPRPAELTATHAEASDRVVLTFAATGCTRIQKEDVAGDNPATTNLAQTRQLFEDLAAMPQVPSHLFMMGDLVLGQKPDDGTELRSQLNAWADLYRTHALAHRCQLVPLPGNHEMLRLEPGSDAEEVNPVAGPVWTQWLQAQHFDTHAGNGPTPRGINPDHLLEDEGALSYSFDLGHVHFILVNTDTFTAEQSIGRAPLAWLAEDLRKAQADPRVGHIFVVGHKPIIRAHDNGDPDQTLAADLQEPMARLLCSTSKVRAYVCAHAHRFEVLRLGEDLGLAGPPQVISGNAGSKLGDGWHPPAGRTFGFVVFKVHADGRVTCTPWQRPAPHPYLGPTQPAQPGEELILHEPPPPHPTLGKPVAQVQAPAAPGAWAGSLG